MSSNFSATAEKRFKLTVEMLFSNFRKAANPF